MLSKTLKEGDIVAVELTFENEVFMLGVVTKAWHQHEGADVQTGLGGRRDNQFWIKARDEPICIRKFEPVRSGSTVFKLCPEDSKCFSIFTDDVRLKLSPGEFDELATDRRGRSADQDPVFGVSFAA